MSKSKRFKVLYSMFVAIFLFGTGFSASLQAVPYAYRNATGYLMNNGGSQTFFSL